MTETIEKTELSRFYQEMIQEITALNEAGFDLKDFHDLHIDAKEAEQYLVDLVYRGVINETQYDLLSATKVSQKYSLKEWCQEKGIEYNTARSLRYRAEVAMRAFEANRRK